MQKAVRQAVVDLGVHKSSVGVEFGGKLPIHGGRISIERAAARRLRGVRAIDRAEAVLKIVIITAHHIHLVGNSVFRSGPKYLFDFIVRCERRVADIGVVYGGAAEADEVARNVGEAGLRVARRCEPR